MSLIGDDPNLRHYARGVFREHRHEVLDGDRPAKEISLIFITIQTGKDIKLPLLLYALSNHLELKFMSQINYGRDQRAVFRIVCHVI